MSRTRLGQFLWYSLHYEKFADGSVKCIEDEIPFELPDGWAWARLGSIANIVTGRLDANAQTKDGAYPFFTCGEEVFKTDSYAFDCNAILLGGNNATGEFKMHKFSGKFNAYQRVYVITTFPEIDVDYLYNHIRHYLPRLQSQSIGSQTRYLKLGMITELLIALPTFCEQKIISRTCNKYINYCTEIASEKNELKSIIKGTKSKILDLAIHGKLVPQDPNDEPASILLERIRAEKEELIKQGKIKRNKKESIIFKGADNSYYEKIGLEVRCIDSEIPFDLPESWMFARLKHIGEVIGGGTPKTNIDEYWDGNIPWLTPADLSGYEDMHISTGARTITELGLKSSSAQLLPENSILYSSRAPIGYIAIAANPISTNQGFKSVVPYNSAMSPYLYYCLKARTSDIVRRATGTTFKEISGSEMAETIVPLPPINEQQRIFDKTTKLLEVLSTIEKSLN